MNIINLEGICKTHGEKMVFDHISYGMQKGDKTGIVGINGTGKSTLLAMIAGLETPDEGQVIRQNGLRIAYLSQNPQFEEGETVLQAVTRQLDIKDAAGVSQARAILNKLAIEDHDQKVELLSGGMKRRAALAGLLVNPSDLLLLDEPTNHLDSEMIIWLEDYLCKYRGSILMVSHDRYFLDTVANHILEISHGQLYAYEENYSGFLEKKAAREEMELASARKQKSILRMEMEWAARGCRARSTKQRARLERLEALKSAKGPAAVQEMEVESVGRRMGRKTIELHGLSKAYGDSLLFRDFDYIILRNQRLGIVGPNGCGKSTLLKIMAGKEKADRGHVEVGETIRIGYFSQVPEDMEQGQRVIDYIRNVAEYVPAKEGRITASQMLERFLFDSAMQYAPVAKLSGGEKRRLQLLKVLMAGPNVLLLDEPTNDLDIATLAIFEDYLASFPGIVVAVSHDRYFLDSIADRIFAFENGGLVQYEGGYSDYKDAFEKKNRWGEAAEEARVKKTGGKDWKRNQPSRLKFTWQEKKDFETIDQDIADLEEQIRGLGEKILRYAMDFVKLQEISEEKEKVEKQLEEKMERWLYLNDLAERIEAGE